MYDDLKRRLAQSQVLAEYENGGTLEQVRNPDGAEALAAITALEAEVARKDAALRALLSNFPPIYWDETPGDVWTFVRAETLGAVRAALADQPAPHASISP